MIERILAGGLGRRRLLGTAAVAMAAAVPAWPGLASASAGRVRLTLPRPSGPHRIGTTSLHLVDRNRADPFVPGRPRELMVSIWYPAHRSERREPVPWMTPGALGVLRESWEAMLGSPPGPPDEPPTTTVVSLSGVDFPPTHARADAPVDRSRGRLPVIVFSPGATQGREQGTVLAEELASHGYAVLTVSHTYQAGQVEFPDGRVARGHHPRQLHRRPGSAAAARRSGRHRRRRTLGRADGSGSLGCRPTGVPQVVLRPLAAGSAEFTAGRAVRAVPGGPLLLLSAPIVGGRRS